MEFFDSLPYVIATIITMLLLFWIIEKFLSLATGIKEGRVAEVYQGGEDVEVKESRYASRMFPYTIYFLILHVIGFISATIFVLVKSGINPFNWATGFFTLVMLYTILMIRSEVLQ